MVDTSGSIAESYMYRVQDFLKDVAVKLGIYSNDARMGVVVYSNSAYHLILLNNQINMFDQIDNLPVTTMGGTNTSFGILTMIDQFNL